MSIFHTYIEPHELGLKTYLGMCFVYVSSFIFYNFTTTINDVAGPLRGYYIIMDLEDEVGKIKAQGNKAYLTTEPTEPKKFKKIKCGVTRREKRS